MTEKRKRIFRIAFQSVITGIFVPFSLFLFIFPIFDYIDLSMFTSELGGIVSAILISCAGLVYVLVRFCSKNVKKWEIILYNVLNIVFIVVILTAVKEIPGIVGRIYENNYPNPYDPITQPDEYEEYYIYNVDTDTIMFGSTLIYVIGLTWIPFLTLVPLVLSILSVVFGLTETVQPNTVSVQPVSVVNSSTLHQINVEREMTEVKEVPVENKAQTLKNSQNNEIRFCRYCGTKITPNSNFCKYCGNKIEK